MKPAVSVVIPTYNRAADVCRALASLQGQTEPGWEAIVVDNHSSDGTRAAVDSLRDARIRLIDVHNQGVVALSRNAGIRAASSEYIAFLDSDDWWAPRKLAASLQALRQGADIVYHDLYIVRSATQRVFVRRVPTRAVASPAYVDLIRNGNALANSSVVVRRSILNDIGGLCEDRALIGFEDFDAWLRVAKVTERFVRVRGAPGYYWQGAANLLTPERALRNLEHFRQRYLLADPAFRDEPLPAWFHYVLGRAYYHLGSHQRALDHMLHAVSGRLSAGARAKALVTATLAASRRLLGAV